MPTGSARAWWAPNWAMPKNDPRGGVDAGRGLAVPEHPQAGVVEQVGGVVAGDEGTAPGLPGDRVAVGGLAGRGADVEGVAGDDAPVGPGGVGPVGELVPVQPGRGELDPHRD